MHASSAREAPYWGSGISTWFDKKPREHRAAFVIGSLEAAEEVSSSGARELFIRCSAPVWSVSWDEEGEQSDGREAG